MTNPRVVIVGSGQAGAEVATALRAQGFQGTIAIVGDETFVPYSRPPLSKAYLMGEIERDRLLLRPQLAYDRHDIQVIGRTRVARIDRSARSLTLHDGRELGFDHLVLATGGRPRPLGHPTLDVAPNVHYLRTIGDADRLRDAMAAGKRLVVIGGGYIGLEVAAAAVRSGVHVTVLETCDRVLSRVTSAPVSRFYERIHREEGVDIRLNVGIEDTVLHHDGSVAAIRLRDGELLPLDLVLVGIGLVPNVELAHAAGLEVENGIVVDGCCRTADAAIFAVGDCSRHPDPVDGRLRRLESVPNAMEQARMVASAIVGKPAAYDAVPWFWSDQYDVKLKTVGLMRPTDEAIVRGDALAGRSFSVFYLREGAVVAADVTSSAKDFAAARTLVSRRAVVDAELLRDEATSLKDIAAQLAPATQPDNPP